MEMSQLLLCKASTEASFFYCKLDEVNQQYEVPKHKLKPVSQLTLGFWTLRSRGARDSFFSLFFSAIVIKYNDSRAFHPAETLFLFFGLPTERSTKKHDSMAGTFLSSALNYLGSFCTSLFWKWKQISNLKLHPFHPSFNRSKTSEEWQEKHENRIMAWEEIRSEEWKERKRVLGVC